VSTLISLNIVWGGENHKNAFASSEPSNCLSYLGSQIWLAGGSDLNAAKKADKAQKAVAGDKKKCKIIKM